MILAKKPVMSQEDTQKDREKKELLARLDEVDNHCGSISLLVSHDYFSDAQLLVPVFLMKAGNLVFSIFGSPEIEDRSRLLQGISSLAEVCPEAREQFSRFAPLFEKYLSSEGVHDLPADQVAKDESAFFDFVERIRKVIKRKARGELRTPMDRYRALRRLEIVGVVCVLIAAVWLVRSWKQAHVQEAFLKSEASIRVRDLMKIRDALENYKKANGSYPATQDRWDGIYTCWGKASPDWIPGLVPNLLPQLPRDPRNHSKCDEQYIYSSDGKGYKLLSHNPNDFPSVVGAFPDMLDPSRPTWAYGFWTSSFKAK